MDTPFRSHRVALRRALERTVFDAVRGDAPPVQRLRGAPHEVWAAATRLVARANIEYLGFDDPSALARTGVVSEAMAVQASGAMHRLIGRGGRLHQVTTPAGLTAAAVSELPTLQHHRGGQARVTERLPFKACVLDRRLALIPLDLDVLPAGALLVRDPRVIKLLVGVHQALWRPGTDAARGERGLPAHLRPILELLASGLPDGRAAERGGLSLRSYSRRVAELMPLLNASSRFDAGVKAARRGWL